MIPIPTETRTRWSARVEFRPGNRKVVHHAIMFLDANGSGRKPDGADGKPGFASLAARASRHRRPGKLGAGCHAPFLARGRGEVRARKAAIWSCSSTITRAASRKRISRWSAFIFPKNR